MAEINNSFKTKGGINIYLYLFFPKIEDNEADKYYLLHGKQVLGVNMADNDKQAIADLVKKAKTALIIENETTKISIDLDHEEILLLANFMQTALSSMFTMNQITFEQILSQNNLFNRISEKRKREIDDDLQTEIKKYISEGGDSVQSGDANVGKTA